MWESLNDGWRTLELMNPKEAQRDLPSVLDWVKQRCATIRGAAVALIRMRRWANILSRGTVRGI